MKEPVKMKEKNKTFTAFSICDKVLMYMNRVVMSLPLQKKILKEFHLGHPGISQMKSLMRSYTYWPQMDNDIEKVVKTCRGCDLAAKSPLVIFQPWPKIDIPWFRLHIDYVEPLNRSYLFPHFGLPEMIVSNNGTVATFSS